MSTIQLILDRKGREVISIPADATVLDASRLMNESRIGALVVVDGDKVAGIFTERDILNRVVACQADPAQTVVRDVMTYPVAVCSPETTPDECRCVMREKRIRHLPVVVDDKLVGIVSVGDLLEYAAEQQQQTIRYLYEYMHGEWPAQTAPAGVPHV